MEKANAKREELLGEAKTLEAKRILGGKAEVGEEPKKEEEDPIAYSQRILRGDI